MCICSSPAGFIFGSDNFHFAKFADEFCMPSPLLIDNCPFDFPVAAIEISDNEFLLAFHSKRLFFHFFFNSTTNFFQQILVCLLIHKDNGPVTRTLNGKKYHWSLVGSFVFECLKSCFVLSVHCALSLHRLLWNSRSCQNRAISWTWLWVFSNLWQKQWTEFSSTLTDDRNLFKCRSAHRTGSGLCPSDVLFAVSSENRIELHIFGCNESERQQQVPYHNPMDLTLNLNLQSDFFVF